MSYIECPHCGHRALSVASRCPHCSAAFPPRPMHRGMAEPRPDWLRPALVLAGVLVLGVVVAAALYWPGSDTATSTATSAPPAVLVDTALPPPAGAGGVPDSPPSALAADPPPTVAPPVAPPRRGNARYARTWTNVREGRGLAAPSVRVLSPGEAVLVDSLRRGWYRVRAKGRTIGYVHRSNLDAAPPTGRP